MGWALFACFGCSNRRKRPRSSKLGSFKTKRIQGYQQLQSVVLKELNDQDIREKGNEEKKEARMRKKVRFNLDHVILYDPIISEEEDPDAEKVLEEHAGGGVSAPETEGVQHSFPAGYRYNNCYGDDDYYDNEEEDSEYEFSDLEDEDEEHEYARDLSSRPLLMISSTDKRLRRTSSDKAGYARHRRHHAVPVLNPVENVSQWKAIKARKCMPNSPLSHLIY